jgi:hypothetical protein
MKVDPIMYKSQLHTRAAASFLHAPIKYLPRASGTAITRCTNAPLVSKPSESYDAVEMLVFKPALQAEALFKLLQARQVRTMPLQLLRAPLQRAFVHNVRSFDDFSATTFQRHPHQPLALAALPDHSASAARVANVVGKVRHGHHRVLSYLALVSHDFK